MNDEQWQHKRSRFLEDAGRSGVPVGELAGTARPPVTIVTGATASSQSGQAGSGERLRRQPEIGATGKRR
jgi:hypothetical protein